MKLIVRKFSADQSIVEKLIKHFKLNPESGDKNPKIHAITYYTEAECFKMTWNFGDGAEMNTAKNWIDKQDLTEGTEVYTKVEGDDYFVTVKFHGHQKLKDLESWIGVKGTKQYFADQIVYRYYIK